MSSATAYSNFIKVQYLHASMSEEREKEGTNFCSSVDLSQERLDISHMFLVSLCASLRSANDRLMSLWLRCDFGTLCNAKILFHTRAYKFFICISRIVNNLESKFPLHSLQCPSHDEAWLLILNLHRTGVKGNSVTCCGPLLHHDCSWHGMLPMTNFRCRPAYPSILLV